VSALLALQLDEKRLSDLLDPRGVSVSTIMRAIISGVSRRSSNRAAR
jgi:hypothetical protein